MFLCVLVLVPPDFLLDSLIAMSPCSFAIVKHGICTLYPGTDATHILGRAYVAEERGLSPSCNAEEALAQSVFVVNSVWAFLDQKS